MAAANCSRWKTSRPTRPARRSSTLSAPSLKSFKVEQMRPAATWSSHRGRRRTRATPSKYRFPSSGLRFSGGIASEDWRWREAPSRATEAEDVPVLFPFAIKIHLKLFNSAWSWFGTGRKRDKAWLLIGDLPLRQLCCLWTMQSAQAASFTFKNITRCPRNIASVYAFYFKGNQFSLEN